MIGSAWTPPPPLTAETPRPRITQAIFKALAKPVVIVTAPAGYGKTVAARPVWEQFDGPKAWWTITSNDRHPEIGLNRLLAAASAAWGVASSPGKENSLPDFLAALGHAEGGLLLIDDAEHASPALWGAIGQMISMAPHRCRTLIFSRFDPPLPLMLWQSQGRLNQLGQTLLALTPEEWAQAGFDGGENACRDACGWWSAEIAARSKNTTGAWNPALAAWVDEAWYSLLPERHQYLFGLASLQPELSADDIGALAGQAKTMAAAMLAELSALPGPIESDNGRVRLAPRYRLYIAQAWRRHHAEAWAQAARNGVQVLLARAEYRRAAELAYESGLPELQLNVLETAGWTLMFSKHRSLLGVLLEAVEILPQQPETARLLAYAWQTEVLKTPHKMEPKLKALLPALSGVRKGQALAISAMTGWAYDDFERSGRDSEEALACFAEDDHPAYHYALLAFANYLAGIGRLHEAERHYRRVMAYARRDELIYLQLDALYRRAHLATEAGRFDDALELAENTRHLAQENGLSSAGILDSIGRLMAWIHLQRLKLDAAKQALAEGAPSAQPFGEYWSFPYRLYRAWFALADDQIQAAQEEVSWLSQRLSEQFYCLKWKNEATLAQLWLAARQLDKPRLVTLERELAACDWPPSLHRDRRSILLAATRLLLGQEPDPHPLQELEKRLRTQGVDTLAQQVRLLLALVGDSFDRAALLQHLRESARQGHAFDYLWLSNRTVAPLEQLLSAPELIHDAATIGFLRAIVQRLLKPIPPAEASNDAESLPPPLGLTDKEWQILQLIGQQFTNEQIAAKLFVSQATIKTHINHIYSKLEIRNRTEAVQRARELGSARRA